MKNVALCILLKILKNSRNIPVESMCSPVIFQVVRQGNNDKRTNNVNCKSCRSIRHITFRYCILFTGEFDLKMKLNGLMNVILSLKIGTGLSEF